MSGKDERIRELETALHLLSQAIEEVTPTIVIHSENSWLITILCCLWFVLGVLITK